MKDILGIIIKPKETIRFIFTVNFLEWRFLKRIMKKKRIEFLKNKEKLRGYSFDGVIIDEWSDLK